MELSSLPVICHRSLHRLGKNLTALLPLKYSYSCCCHGRYGQKGAYNGVWILLVSLAGALWFQLRTLTLLFDTVRVEKEISRHCPPLDSVAHYPMEDGKWNLLFPLFAYVVPSWLSTSCVAKLKWRPCFDPLSIPIWCFYVFWHMMKCVVKHHGGGFLPHSCNLPMRIVDREVRMPGKITSSYVATNPWQLVGIWLTLIKMLKKSSAFWCTDWKTLLSIIS